MGFLVSRQSQAKVGLIYLKLLIFHNTLHSQILNLRQKI